MLKRIHVNRHNIEHNKKCLRKDRKMVFTVKTYKGNTYGFEVECLGESRLVYRPDKPLNCGAVAWIETRGPISIDGKIMS